MLFTRHHDCALGPLIGDCSQPVPLSIGAAERNEFQLAIMLKVMQTMRQIVIVGIAEDLIELEHD